MKGQPDRMKFDVELHYLSRNRIEIVSDVMRCALVVTVRDLPTQLTSLVSEWLEFQDLSEARHRMETETILNPEQRKVTADDATLIAGFCKRNGFPFYAGRTFGGTIVLMNRDHWETYDALEEVRRRT